MTPAIFVTGVTGFVGRFVARSLLGRGIKFHALVRDPDAAPAELKLAQQHGALEWVQGDLSRPGLGIDGAMPEALRTGPVTVLHIAAYYRLSGNRDVLLRTNVEGLGNLLAAIAPLDVEAFHHVSSVVAAGDVGGPVRETPHPAPRRFRNAYEESKWKAEALIASQSRFPVRIYRPGIVIGCSRTGEISKFDGPYEAFGMVRPWLPFPLPSGSAAPFPLVCVDLVADVLSAGLFARPTGLEIWHVLDTGFPTLAEFSREIAVRIGGGWFVSVPAPLMTAASMLPGFQALTGLEPQAVPYMSATWRFSTAAFRAFADSHAIPTARIATSYDRLVAYYRLLRPGRVRMPAAR